MSSSSLKILTPCFSQGKKTFNFFFAVFAGHCPIYNYAFGATAATSRSCINFTRGCPDPEDSPYHSSSFHKCTFIFCFVL